MGIFDKAKDLIEEHGDEVKDFIEEHDDQVKDGIDKAAELIEGKAGADHADKIEGAANKAKEFVDNLDDPPGDKVAD